jgi:hypothetical protein
MPTRNTKLLSNRNIKPSLKNLDAKKSCLSKNNIPMKFSQHNKLRTEEQTRPQSFASEKPQEPDEEMGTLRMKDANKTKVVRSILNSPAAVNPSDSSTHQRHAAKKPRGKNPKLKIKVLMAAVSLPPRSARKEISAGNPE